MKYIIPIVAAFVMGIALGVLFATPAERTIQPCEYEDSRNCFWDAGESGNGQGTSFVDVNGEVYYRG